MRRPAEKQASKQDKQGKQGKQSKDTRTRTAGERTEPQHAGFMKGTRGAAGGSSARGGGGGGGKFRRGAAQEPLPV